MARTNNLTDFLTDVADSIREKKGTSEPILASDFDTEIASIESGGDTSEYFYDTVSGTPGDNQPIYSFLIKKTPPMTLADNVTQIRSAFANSQIQEVGKMTSTGATLTNAYMMFQNCPQLTSADLSGLDTSQISNFGSMFRQCTNLTKLDVSSFTGNSATYLSSMFYRCEKLTEINLANFNTPNVTDISGMFRFCYALKKLDIRSMTFNSVTSSSSAFNNIPTDCEIIVKSDTEKQYILGIRSDFTNIKTVAEL